MAAKKEVRTVVPTIEMPKFEMPKFDVPAFDMPKMEVPAAVREMAEKSVAQARDTYEKVKAAAEETTDLIEDSYATATKGATDIAGKALENAKSNTVAAFDFYKDIMGAKTVAELIEKQTSFARAQFETLSAQAKDMQAMSQQLATDSVAPYKAAAEKAMAQFKTNA
jgi:phasin